MYNYKNCVNKMLTHPRCYILKIDRESDSINNFSWSVLTPHLTSWDQPYFSSLVQLTVL